MAKTIHAGLTMELLRYHPTWFFNRVKNGTFTVYDSDGSKIKHSFDDFDQMKVWSWDFETVVKRSKDFALINLPLEIIGKICFYDDAWRGDIATDFMKLSSDIDKIRKNSKNISAAISYEPIISSPFSTLEFHKQRFEILAEHSGFKKIYYSFLSDSEISVQMENVTAFSENQIKNLEDYLRFLSEKVKVCFEKKPTIDENNVDMGISSLDIAKLKFEREIFTTSEINTLIGNRSTSLSSFIDKKGWEFLWQK